MEQLVHDPAVVAAALGVIAALAQILHVWLAARTRRRIVTRTCSIRMKKIILRFESSSKDAEPPKEAR